MHAVAVAVPAPCPVVVGTDTIVSRVLPILTVNEATLRKIIAKFDPEEKGGLTEAQWSKLCQAHPGIFTIRSSLPDFEQLAAIAVTNGMLGPVKEGRSLAQAVVSFLEGFAAGGLAGAISKTLIAPGDRVKIIFQVDSSRRFSLLEAWKVAKLTVQRSGLIGLWQGNGATMMRVVPYASITFASFDAYNSTFHWLAGVPANDYRHGTMNSNEATRNAVLCRFLAGSCAGATATAATYPFDMMRARFAAASSDRGGHLSYRVAYSEIIRKRGFLGLYSGLWPTLAGIVPYAGCSFGCFETFKYYLVQVQGFQSDRDIPAHQRMVAGAMSGLVAQSFTYPLDIVRRRMQVQPDRYLNVRHALREIFHKEGLIGGLYKGLTMNWIKGPIAVSTSFTVNDLVKSHMRQYRSDQERLGPRQRVDEVPLPETLACGATAGAIAKFWTTPFDKVRLIYQVGLSPDMHGTSLWRKVRKVARYAYADMPHFWQNCGIVQMRVVPYAALTYAFYYPLQARAERLLYSHEPNVLTNFVAGAAAASCATTVVYPLDLIRVRNAMSSTPNTQTYYWQLLYTVRKRGVLSLWEGCSLSVLGMVPMAGIGFASYELLKSRFGCDTFGQQLLAGATAGFASQIATYPLQIARRTNQVEKALYRRLGSLRFVFTKRGFSAALYRRMPFSWTFGSMTIGLSFAVNDLCRDTMSRARRELLRERIFNGNGVADNGPETVSEGLPSCSNGNSSWSTKVSQFLGCDQKDGSAADGGGNSASTLSYQ